MDQTRFDDLARRLGAGATRRAGLKAALGGLLGLAIGPAATPAREAGAKKRKKKKRAGSCPVLCPSGSACVNGACACTRELCGGACCAGNQTCQDGRCVATGLRSCSTDDIADGADLSYCDLRGQTVPDGEFERVNFEGADLSGVRRRVTDWNAWLRVWNCRFDRANLSNADLGPIVIWEGCTFADAILRGARLEGAYLTDAAFQRADLTNASLYKAHFDGGSFAMAVLDGANLRGVEMTGLDLDGARLNGADLAAATLQKVAAMDVDFSQAKLQGVEGFWTSQATSFSRCTLARARFGSAPLKLVGFTNCDLADADFSRGDVRGARFETSTLTGADFSGARFGWAASEYLPRDTSATQFIDCGMTGATLTGTTVSGQQDHTAGMPCRLASVDLRGAAFGDPYGHDQVDWRGVNLTGATGWREPAGGYLRWCWNLLPDGSRSSREDCQCDAGADACWPRS